MVRQVGRVAKGGGQRWRQVLVAVHVVTSVGWMGQALAIFVLTMIGTGAADAEVRFHAYWFAGEIDNMALIYLGNAGAYTGLVLSALTPWGYFRYWWVATKFALTVAQLTLGIVVLDTQLSTAVDGARAGQPVTTPGLVLGSALMAAGLACQVWLAVAKPWGRTPWHATAGRAPTAPRWAFALALAVAAGDLVLYLVVFGTPVPMLMMLATVAFPLMRRRWWPAPSLTRRPAHASAT